MATPPSRPAADLNTVDAFAQFSFLVQGTLERRAGEREISIVQTRLLGILRDRQPTMNELARLLELDKSSVTGLVDRAERRGLVERAPSTSDRRVVQVGLTAEGRALVTDVAARFEADVSAMVESLSTSDRATLVRLLGRVLVAHANGRAAV